MPARPHRTVVTIDYDTAGLAHTVERSLRQEVDALEDDRARTRLARDGGRLELSVEAADLVALRAAVNTWLSLVSVAERVGETVDF